MLKYCVVKPGDPHSASEECAASIEKWALTQKVFREVTMCSELALHNRFHIWAVQGRKELEVC